MPRLFKNPLVGFVTTNLLSKVFAAISQMYAVFIFSKLHTREEAALIFLLFGYSIWFQLFEFGLAQTLQNKFNSSCISPNEMVRVAVVHLVCVWLFAIVIVNFPALTNTLLLSSQNTLNPDGLHAFSMGASILLIASNNVIVQRMLLVFNLGKQANLINIYMSSVSICLLTLYFIIGKTNLILAVLLYLGPQIIIYMPILIKMIIRFGSRSRIKTKSPIVSILSDSVAFWGASLLSSLYLGLDYYFIAHNVVAEEIIAYYLVCRIFFLSFIVYYAYVQHRSRRLSADKSDDNYRSMILLILKESIIVGLLSVSIVFCFANVLKKVGFISYMTNGLDISLPLLISGFCYYTIRVFRDVFVVISSVRNAIFTLYFVYFLEIIIGFSAMIYIVPSYGGIGVFVSMSLASSVPLLVIFIEQNRYKLSNTSLFN